MEDNVEGKVEEKLEELKEENLISQLLAKKMREGHMSTRDVAKITGVAHTTVMRVLNRNVVSVKTLQGIASFLGTDPGGFVQAPGGTTLEAVSMDIATIIGYDKDLNEKIKKAAELVKTGNISADVVKECVRFIVWRIGEQAVELDDGITKEEVEEKELAV